ncbi:bacillithiol biosynthesis cysteine-adding enzyme BshC [Alkalicella caledoniensis]|uniref:Putative cysteine ligase BshC n=1 Tax=Alkalicella caledoniensis TaxID=2731377 RepID=A0A7G9W6V2_ALKCA|nr:bacillithiol biosynthesis cysteine-adding enzyme BshC [Alkalicella caledoniensis]QNO14414.1 bacillithiol biosynthesis cysteine-adding enzyme BshC [Alkalicella caledoniensis]
MPNIYQEYIAEKGSALSLFDYSPTIPQIHNRYEEINDKKATVKLCTYLEGYNNSLGCSKKTLENIQRLRNGAKTVVTGQQSGLLLGPTYTIYKALTAVRLAEQLTKEGKDVVPVFWIADEDHDWQEVNHTYLLDVKGNPQKLKIELDVQDSPVHHINLQEENLEELLGFIQELGFDQSFTKTVRNMLVDTYSKNFSKWFAKLLTYILKDTGLILIDSKADILKEQGKEVFTNMIEKRSELIQNLSTVSTKIKELGYNLQNPFDEVEESNLFIFKDNKRYKLKYLGNEQYSIKTGEVLTKEDVKDYINKGLVSPNVFLRLIVQDTSLPTVAFVGGPGEISYLAQIKDLYHSITNSKLPVIFPRQSFMVIESPINKLMKRYSLNYTHIHNLDLEKNKLIHNGEWELIQKEFELVKNDIIQQYKRLTDKISTINTQLSTIGEKNLQLITNQVGYLEKKAFNFHKENHCLVLEHFNKIEKNLYPNNIEQQRSLSIIYYLIKYDFSFIQKVTEGMDITNFSLQYIEL